MTLIAEVSWLNNIWVSIIIWSLVIIISLATKTIWNLWDDYINKKLDEFQ